MTSHHNTNTLTVLNPPKPPDGTNCQMTVDTSIKPSYREILRNKPNIFKDYQPSGTLGKQPKIYTSADDKAIYLSHKDKQRLYAPWQHSVIIKLMGKKFNHQYLRT